MKITTKQLLKDLEQINKKLSGPYCREQSFWEAARNNIKQLIFEVEQEERGAAEQDYQDHNGCEDFSREQSNFPDDF